MLGLIVAFSLINSGKKINKLLSLFIISVFMSSNVIFLLFIIFILFVMVKDTNLNSVKIILIIFLLVSQLNSFIESQENEKFTFIISECIEKFNTEICNSDGYK